MKFSHSTTKFGIFLRERSNAGRLLISTVAPEPVKTEAQISSLCLSTAALSLADRHAEAGGYYGADQSAAVFADAEEKYGGNSG